MNYADPNCAINSPPTTPSAPCVALPASASNDLMAGESELANSVEDWELRLNLLAELAPADRPAAAPMVQKSPAALAGTPRRCRAPGSADYGRMCAFGAALARWRLQCAAALGIHIALEPPRLDPDVIATLDQRLTGIENATGRLAGTPSEISTLATRLAGIENRLNAATLAPSHVAVLIDKYQRPMMTADLNVDQGRLALRLNITPPRDFSGKTLEIWMMQPDGALRSLGLFPSERSGTTTVLILAPSTAESLAQGKLEVSLEPVGGSSTARHRVPFCSRDRCCRSVCNRAGRGRRRAPRR